jgi:SAM-dependent methyltransferase
MVAIGIVAIEHGIRRKEPLPMTTESHSAPDFDALYRGESQAGTSGLDGIPWDIGRAQPEVVAFERAGRITGAVLDVGCGLGYNALFLAGAGYRVTGVDASPAAIERARVRAAEQGADVEFAVADATSLDEIDGFDGRFDTVLDSALYHCLDDEQRTRYAAALYRVTKPGARLNMLCFADIRPDGIPAPLPVAEENVRSTLTGAGWKITGLSPAGLLAATASMGEFLDEFELHGKISEDGTIPLPIWSVTADRT